jgi:hypothetical protein
MSSAHELLQLGACLLFPVGLLAVFLWNVGTQHGRTQGQIVGSLLVIVLCVGGVVTIGWWLSVARAGPLISYETGSFALGSIGPLDVLGLVVCALLVGAVLCVVRGLSRPLRESNASPDASDGRA